MKQFDPTKPVQCRDGSPARIICTDLKHETYPIVAAMLGCDGERAIYVDREGRYSPPVESPKDLVNLPEKIKLWLNVYRSVTGSIAHTSRANADESADKTKRIACVEIEVTEGQGL